MEAARADPARSPVPVPSPVAPGDTPTPGAGAVQDAVPAPVAASVWPFRRQLTTVEARALVDPVTIDEQWQTAVETALQAWADVRAAAQDAILNAVAAAFGTDRRVRGPHRRPAPDVVAGITQIMLTVAQQAQVGQVEEMVGQGVDLPGPPDLPSSTCRRSPGRCCFPRQVDGDHRVAEAIAAYAAPGATKDDVEAQVAGALDTFHPPRSRGTFGAIMSYGRVRAARASSRPRRRARTSRPRSWDANTCGPCAAIDGTVFPSPGGRQTRRTRRAGTRSAGGPAAAASW